MKTFHPGIHSSSRKPLIEIIKALGLSGNLKLCFDAGDKIDPDNDLWEDVSGNDDDISVDFTNDFQFNGVVGGLSRNESIETTDTNFTLVASEEAWVQNLHKDAAVFTVLALVKPISLSLVLLCSNIASPSFGTTKGFNFFMQGASGKLATHFVSSNSIVNGAIATTVLSVDEFNFVALSINGTFSANDFLFQTNETQEDIGQIVVGAASTVTANPLRLLQQGDGALEPLIGTEIMVFAMWEGVALTATQIEAIRKHLIRRI